MKGIASYTGTKDGLLTYLSLLEYIEALEAWKSAVTNFVQKYEQA